MVLALDRRAFLAGAGASLSTILNNRTAEALGSTETLFASACTFDHGGHGMVREIEFLKPLTVSLLTNRRTNSPYGVAGGESGSKSQEQRSARKHSRLNAKGRTGYRIFVFLKEVEGADQLETPLLLPFSVQRCREGAPSFIP